MTDSKTPVAPKVPDNAKDPGTSSHAAPRNDFMFSINRGEESTQDYAKVQNYIKGLESSNKTLADTVAEHEKFKAELNEYARAEFVDELLEAGKILAPMKEKTVELCKGMTDEQFASYKEIMTAAAPSSLTQDHSVQQSAPVGSDAGEGDGKADRIGVLKEIVSAHKAANPNDMEFVKSTSTYKELIELDPTYQL